MNEPLPYMDWQQARELAAYLEGLADLLRERHPIPNCKEYRWKTGTKSVHCTLKVGHGSSHRYGKPR